MTATQTLPTRSATPGAGFGRLLHSEWTKFRSVRSTLWSLLVLIVTDVALTAILTAVIVKQWNTLDPGRKAHFNTDPGGTILGSGVELGQLAVCVLGVLVIASEYSTGMIRSSLLAAPTRLPILGAKACVLAVTVFVVAELGAFPSFVIGSAIVHSKADVSMSSPGALRAIIGTGLYLTMLALFAFAIGALIRHAAAGITTVIGFVLVLAPLAQLLPGSVGKHIHAYLPSEAGRLVMQTSPQSGDLLTPWQGYGVFAVWTAGLLIAAGFVIRIRDAS